jgi:hypothetical protein
MAPQLKKTPEFIEKLLSISPTTFQWADDSIRNDEVFVRKNMKNNPDIVLYCGESLRENSKFMLDAIEESNQNAKVLSPLLAKDPNFVSSLSAASPQCFQYFDPCIRSTEKFRRQLHELDPDYLNTFSHIFRDDATERKLNFDVNDLNPVPPLFEEEKKEPEVNAPSSYDDSNLLNELEGFMDNLTDLKEALNNLT